jgi:hypothetical protein
MLLWCSIIYWYPYQSTSMYCVHVFSSVLFSFCFKLHYCNPLFFPFSWLYYLFNLSNISPDVCHLMWLVLNPSFLSVFLCVLLFGVFVLFSCAVCVNGCVSTLIIQDWIKLLSCYLQPGILNGGSALRFSSKTLLSRIQKLIAPHRNAKTTNKIF